MHPREQPLARPGVRVQRRRRRRRRHDHGRRRRRHKKPFTTNATGVATGLNADRVDNLDAAGIVATARVKTGLDADTVDGLDSNDLRPRFALISRRAPCPRPAASRYNPVVHTGGTGLRITFTGDLTKCASSANLTGENLGEIVADPQPVSGNTKVTVTTASSAGVPGERRFDLSLNC